MSTKLSQDVSIGENLRILRKAVVVFIYVADYW